MLNHLLPKQISNDYRGDPKALWLFGAVVLMKLGIGFGTMLNGRDAAATADGIDLASFSPLGQDAFVSLFAAWGLGQLTINALSVLALVRYRALVPFMFLLLLTEHLARKLIFFVMPIARTGIAPGLYINIAIVAVMVVGLVLSLRQRGTD